MIIVGGSASKSLSENLANELGAQLAQVESKMFPDGESYVRIYDDLSGQDVILVQTTYPNNNLIELMLLADAINEFGPASLTTVVPYFAYARQDKKFQDGEAISARAMIKHVQIGAGLVLTVDIHNPDIFQWFDVPAKDVSGMPQIAAFLQTLDTPPDLILSPDEGAKGRAQEVASIMGCQADYLEEHRIDGSTVEIKSKELPVNGRVVAIVDDIISTGGTIIKATESLKAQGAASVIDACTHGLYAASALEKLAGVCDLVVSTDTIESQTSKASVAKEIAKAINQ